MNQCVIGDHLLKMLPVYSIAEYGAIVEPMNAEAAQEILKGVRVK
jgi:hypothetical protein